MRAWWTFALLALAGARADVSEECVQDTYMIPADRRRPKMTVTANMRSCPDIPRRECTIPHGGDTTVTIQCSSDDAENLHIHKYQEHDLETERINSTTIQLKLVGLQRGAWYYCKDDKTNCENAVNVDVDIMMSVISSTDHYRVDSGNVDSFFVVYKDSYEVFCRAKDSALIKMNTYGSEPLALDILNETTVKIKRQADRIGEELYLCHGDNGPYSKRMLSVVIDHHAEAHNFRCIFHTMRKLECSWTSSSERNTFKLFYIFPSFPDKPHFICSDFSGDINGSCAWNNRLFGRRIVELHYHTLDLLLETCNEFYCSNQTYNFLPREITKLDVTDLKVVNTSSHGADLSWRAPLQFIAYNQGRRKIYRRIRNLDYIYTIQYRLPSAAWRQVNTSSVACDRIDCKFHLDLPCPDERYQVQVYVRIKQAADRFWSEPSSLFIHTEVNTDAVNPECYAPIPETEPITDAETASNEIDKLMSLSMNEKMALKKYLRDMRLKLAEVKRRMDV